MPCKIDIGFSPADCFDLGIGGVTGNMYLINFDDWKSATITRSVDKTITDVVLTTVGASAFKYELTRGGAAPASPETVNNGGKSGFAHSVVSFIPTREQAIKTEFAKLANFSRVIAILVMDDNKVVSEVYGDEAGLVLTAFDETPGDPAKGGGIQPTLGTPADTTLETLPPVNFFDTDRATTIAKLEALLVPVV